MRRRWLLLTSSGCLVLVAASLLLSGRAPKATTLSEWDGARLVQGKRLGLFPYTGTQNDSRLRVSDDFARELRRLRLRLPAKAVGLDVGAHRNPMGSMVRYDLSGTYRGTPRQAAVAFAALFKSSRLYSMPDNEQMSGVGIDGRSVFDVVASPNGGTTMIAVGLEVPAATVPKGTP